MQTQATPFQADCALKAGGWREYNDRKLRAKVCAECLKLKAFHFDTGCRWRRMTDKDWAEYCGVELPPKREEYQREVIGHHQGEVLGQYTFRLACDHQERRFYGGLSPNLPKTLKCFACATEAQSSQTAVAGSKTLEEVEGMSLEKIQFPPNVAQQVALKFPEGKIVEGRFGDQVYFTLADPPESCMYVDMGVAEMVNRLQLRRGEPVVICKRSSGKKGAVPQWEVYRPNQEPARPAPRPPVDATGIEESDIEREIRERKVAELRATIARLEAGAAVSPTAPVQTNTVSATPASIANGNGNKPQNGSNGNGPNGNGNGNGAPRPYEAAGIPPPPVKIPADVAFVEIVRLVAEGLKAAGEQWSDAARQDAVSTIYIQAARDGFLALWTRGVK